MISDIEKQIIRCCFWDAKLYFEANKTFDDILPENVNGDLSELACIEAEVKINCFHILVGILGRHHSDSVENFLYLEKFSYTFFQYYMKQKGEEIKDFDCIYSSTAHDNIMSLVPQILGTEVNAK